MREKFVRPLGGRHGREAFVRARFRRMRIVRHRVRITGKARSNHVSLGLKYVVYDRCTTKPSEAPTI